ncbi:MAG: HAMP domain-containing sensor histidine kinase [Chitinophagaceae bacterium]
MSVRTIRGNLLFWKITAVFSALLLVLGVIFILIASRFSKTYYTTAHQELFGDLASHLAGFTRPFKNGKPDTVVTHDIIHSTMVANPSVEVYLLDTAGNIVDYVVPDKTVQVKKVNIDLVRKWLAAPVDRKPLGDNPKQPGEPGIFSAAAVYEQGQLTGYVYAVLASERQKEILSSLTTRSYIRLAVYMFFAALVIAFIVGVITFFLITDSICRIAAVVKRFKEGDRNARITGYGKGNLGMLTSTFNEMADTIVENINQISATDRYRQELVANVSHDLRTPLSIMQGYIETLLMKNDELTAHERERYLSTVYDGSRKLSGLVDQLFQYAKLEANLVTPQKEQFRLQELASDIVSSYQLKADERKIDLQLSATADLPVVFADLALTERVFQNLLDNAFKFTPDGGRISIRMETEKDAVKVWITDNGSGIALEDQPFIFERYKRSSATAGSPAGMGIGLAIVRKILELHQASIGVFSEPGKGTSFWFTVAPVIA